MLDGRAIGMMGRGSVRAKDRPRSTLRSGDILGDQNIMVNGGFVAGVQTQNTIENFAFRLGHAAMQNQVFLPRRRDRLHSEDRMVRETFVEPNAGCSVA